MSNEEYDGTLTAEGEELHYHGWKRDWNPLPGHIPPEGQFVELVEEEYGMVGVGRTFEEALQQLTLLCGFQVYAKRRGLKLGPQTFASYCEERNLDWNNS
jgi:hypothetical protein